MKPINTIIKMTVVGVVLFTLNACDKKSIDDANASVPTHATQQDTPSDGASTPNDHAANPVAEYNGDGTNNTQAAAPAQESGTVTGGVRNGGDRSNGENGSNGSNSVNGQSSNVGGSDTHEASEAQDNNGTTTQTEDTTTTNSTDEQNTTTSTETNTTTTGDTNTTDMNDTNATEGNDENTTDNGDDNTTTTADVTPPVITLKGEANITLAQGEPYKELGATAVDAVDGNVSVSISGTVDTNTTGRYTVTYTAKDKAGNEATVTRDVSVVAPTLTGMTLESNATTLNVGESVRLFVTGTYTNGNRKKIDANISYTVTPSDKADINNNILIAKKDGNVTVQATLDGKTSNPVTLSIYWEVNGHRLPPEPDPKVNNATLLGIDSNNNGVRDDVERWIYETYDTYIPCKDIETICHGDLGDFSCIETVCEDRPVPYHPVVREAMMEIARQAQIIIQEPEKAGETVLDFTKAFACAGDISFLKDKNNRKISESLLLDKKFKSIQFNTVQRVRAYANFNYYLSGGVYESLSTDYVLKKWCSPKIQEMIKDLK